MFLFKKNSDRSPHGSPKQFVTHRRSSGSLAKSPRSPEVNASVHTVKPVQPQPVKPKPHKIDTSTSVNVSSLETTPTGLSAAPPVLSSPSSPVSRRSVSERLAPASYVRHSRVLSMSSTSNSGLGDLRPSKSLRRRMKTITHDLQPELSPVVNLINAQRLRTYVSGAVWIKNAQTSQWLPAEATLTGTELAIWVDGSSNPKYVNIQDCSVLPGQNDGIYELTILQNFDNNQEVLRFDIQQDLLSWLSALHLSKFEQTSLNEAFTAVVLSLKGPELSDIFTLLSHKKRFARFEWVNLRLPQVSSKWIKTYMSVIPGDGKKKGRIEIYTNDKINKKSLILYVNDADAVYNVYPEDHRVIDNNSIMKLEGQVFVNKDYEHLFSGQPVLSGNNTPSGSKIGSRTGSNTSLSSLANQPAPHQHLANRSRSASVNSTHSFFTNSPTPNKNTKESVTPGSPPRNTTNHFYKNNKLNKFVTTNYVYLMPLPHPGVSAIEIMIRNFVHIIDAFHLYGRPSQLNSDKKNTISMLFGLPSLPHYGYMSTEDAFDLVEANYDTSRIQNWTELDWRNCLKEYLSVKQVDGPYKGDGNIADLFESVEADSPVSESATPLGAMMSPRISFPQSSSRVASPPPRFSSSLQADSFGGEINHLSLNDTSLGQSPSSPAIAPALKLNDNKFLGGPIEFNEGVPSPHSSDEMLRSLEPIVDLPTPMDEKHVVSSYFSVATPSN